MTDHKTDPQQTAGSKGCDTGEPARSWVENGRIHLYLIGLTPPRPIIEVLQFIQAEEDTAVIIHVPHLPLHLFPELEDRAWRWTVLSQTDDETVLLLEQGLPPADEASR